jgi:phospholipid transport system transporter-binding protein
MTNNAANVTLTEGKFLVTGELSVYNVMSIYKKSMRQLAMCRGKNNKIKSVLYFDFTQLKASDSAGLALIIEWIKFAKRHHEELHFSALSDDIMSIAKAAGIHELILSAIKTS